MSLKQIFLIIISAICLDLTNFSSLLMTEITRLDSYEIQILNHRTEQRMSFNRKPIQVVNGKVILGESLQQELEGEINRAKGELEELANNFSLQFTEDVGIVYFHKGYDDWSIKFTFGGLLLTTSEEIIFSTDQVFALKNCFDKVEWIEIQGKQYQTTGRMRQLGPILHEEEKKK